MDDYDFVIIGAGAAGINAAYQVKTQMPGARFVMLESRDSIGGTWNFFKFPGIRSDSFLTGFGFRWRPWVEEKEIASGASIQKYLEESFVEAGLDKHLQVKHRVTGIHWSSDECKWTLNVAVDGGKSQKTLKAGFILACSGYYDYETPLRTEIPGISNFKGQVVHPQFWPEDLEYSNKRVVVIGSGATTITIFPVLAKTAAHVTMLQRSPTYVLPMPSAPPHIVAVRKWLPAPIASFINFWKDVVVSTLFGMFCTAYPLVARKMLLKAMEKSLEGSGIPVDPHFTPRYNPWEQRVCVCPDGDFYDSLKQDNTAVVTDQIETVTESGIKTKGGKTIDADIIVTATGLNFVLLCGITATVDGEVVHLNERFAWRFNMLEGVPNMALVTGSTHMSWTLGTDSGLKLMLRLVKEMKKRGAVAVKPIVHNRDALNATPVISMQSTYFKVARHKMPRQSNSDPWQSRKGYIPELWFAKFAPTSSLTKGLEFVMPGDNHRLVRDTEATHTKTNGTANGKTNGQKQD
ncbi:unnamed protein product [Discula destructiva]